MKLRADLKINGKLHQKGSQISWYMIYPFFLIHMLAFGLSGFFMAYSSDGPQIVFLFMHGGIAISVYTVFYLAIFGMDEVKWMFINAGLGVMGIYAQMDWILAFFGKNMDEFSPFAHVIPFLYYVLYTFLLRQMILDLTGAREDERKKKTVEGLYVGGSVLIYGGLFLLDRL